MPGYYEPRVIGYSQDTKIVCLHDIESFDLVEGRKNVGADG